MIVLVIVLRLALTVYLIALWARFVLDLVRSFGRGWRPGPVLVVFVEAVYTVTDPPIRFFRRIIPPLRLGTIALDFGWTITLFLTWLALSLVRLIPVY